MIEQYDLLWFVTNNIKLIEVATDNPSLWDKIVAIDQQEAEKTTKMLEQDKQKAKEHQKQDREKYINDNQWNLEQVISQTHVWLDGYADPVVRSEIKNKTEINRYMQEYIKFLERNEYCRDVLPQALEYVKSLGYAKE